MEKIIVGKLQQITVNYHSLWVSFCLLHFYVYPMQEALSSWQLVVHPSQTTPVQIMHVFVLCYSTQIVRASL